MATAVLPPPQFLPPTPVAKFRIGQYEPLVWLVSILFTEEFWKRDELTRASIGLFNFGDPNAIEKPKYESWPELYQAVEKWVTENENAAACLAETKAAIARGELSYYLPEADRWGDRPFHEPERDIDSYEFLIWFERKGHAIPKDVADACYTTIHMAINRKQAQEQQAYSYPAITAEDFAKLRKEPLWEVNAGILYLMGRRSRIAGKESGYKGDKGLFDVVAEYVMDANRAEAETSEHADCHKNAAHADKTAQHEKDDSGNSCCKKGMCKCANGSCHASVKVFGNGNIAVLAPLSHDGAVGTDQQHLTSAHLEGIKRPPRA